MDAGSPENPATTNPDSCWTFHNIETCPLYARMCAWIERDCAAWGCCEPSRLDMELSDGGWVHAERVDGLEAESGVAIGACAGTNMKVKAVLRPRGTEAV